MAPTKVRALERAIAQCIHDKAASDYEYWLRMLGYAPTPAAVGRIAARVAEASTRLHPNYLTTKRKEYLTK